MFGKNNMVIGNVVKELRFNRFGIGFPSWKWKRRWFKGFSINPSKAMNPHIILVGESGGGKSNACKVIVSALCTSGAKVAVLDPHNEYLAMSESIGAEIYDASRNGVNIMELDGMSERERASELTGMLKRNFRLGEVQSYTLYRCIQYTYGFFSRKGKTPGIHDLAYSLRIFKKNARTTSDRNVIEGLERRLSLIDSGAFEKSVGMSQIMAGNSVILLSGLHTPEAQSIYIEGFLRKVYSNMLMSKKSGSARMYVVIDEAEKLGDNPIIGRLAAEGRKYGIGIIAISQRAKLIDKDLRGNASMIVSFGVREPEELNYIANFIAGGNEMGRYIETKKALRSLGRGYAVVSCTERRNPLLVRFEKNRVEGENLTYRITELARNGIREEEILDQMSTYDLLEIKERIRVFVESGKLRSCRMECGTYSGEWYISNNHNSPEHDIAVWIISRHLSSLGIGNRVYNNSYGPDVIAYIGGKPVAIEYETGSKDIDSSMKMIESRKEKYTKTVVIVNDGCYEEYSKRLAGVIKLSELVSADFES